MNIVFLVINYMPHQLVSIKAVLKNKGVTVHSFSFKEPHSIPDINENHHSYKHKDFSRFQFLNKIVEIGPEILVVAGWAVRDFVWVAKKIRKRLNIPVVSYSDTQWLGTWTQKINSLISPFYLQKAFTHIWVAGVYQYEYARKLGFAKSQIIYNALSCDVELFKKVSVEQKLNSYPKNFLFIGRFVPVKGLDSLLEAWDLIKDKQGWQLTLVGDGKLKEEFINCEGVVTKGFMPQNLLIKELENAGCFILPSVFEPWALVIHEATASGLPIIATDVCGAAPHFVIDGYNGYQVKPKVLNIKHAMEGIMAKDPSQLYEMSKNSQKLAKSITPELGAAQLLSVLNKF